MQGGIGKALFVVAGVALAWVAVPQCGGSGGASSGGGGAGGDHESDVHAGEATEGDAGGAPTGPGGNGGEGATAPGGEGAIPRGGEGGAPASGGAPSGRIAARYSVTEIKLEGTASISTISAINDSGLVLGSYTDVAKRYAFTWTVDAGFTVVAEELIPVAGGLNADGDYLLNDVAGEVGFLGRAGSHERLPSPPGQAFLASGLNASGTIVGEGRAGSTQTTGFRLENGQFTPLYGLPNGRYDTPHAINTAGVSVGDAVDELGVRHAIRYGAEEPEVLDTLDSVSAEAYDINERGSIVGTYSFDLNVPRAFYFADGQLKDLGHPSSGSGSVAARAINDGELVVGEAEAAFAWSPSDGLVDLNTRLGGVTGWQLMRATDVNNGGQIVGIASLQGVGQVGFLLTPLAGAGPAIPVFQGDSNSCGDGVIDEQESCDGASPLAISCYEHAKGSWGTVRCTDDCSIDLSTCSCPSWQSQVPYTLCPNPEPACVDLMIDEVNCGACDRACAASEICSRGHCVALLATANDPEPSALTVDDTSVYYAGSFDGIIYSLPKAGGAAPKAITTVSFGQGARDMLIAGNDTYWSTAKGVARVARTGGVGAIFADQGANTVQLDSDGTGMWWTVGNQVHAAPLATGVVTTPVSAAVGRPSDVKVTSSYLIVAYFGATVDEGSVIRFNHEGGDATPLALLKRAAPYLCVDEANAFFYSDRKIYVVPLDASSPAKVLSEDVGGQRLDGNAIVRLSDPVGLTCDGDYLYWGTSINDWARIERMPKQGGPHESLILGADLVPPFQFRRYDAIASMALDATYLYWTMVNDYGVFRVRKDGSE